MDALQGETVDSFESIQEAFKSALEQTKNNQLILVCGSFHTLEAVGVFGIMSMNNKQRWMGGVVLLGGGVLLAALL
jgi:hypothetical protein